MKLYEEFKLYESLWDIDESLTEWVDASGNIVNRSNIPVGNITNNTKTVASSNNNKLYVIFNYLKSNDLDNFCMIEACETKTDAIKALIDEAKFRIQGFGGLHNKMVCYLIDPADYDLSINEFIDAANDKYNSGQDLHYEHTDVVYAISSMAEHETPIYELTMGDIQTEFYDDFLSHNSQSVGITFDDLYDSNFDRALINQVYNNAAFQKFMLNKLNTDINKAL
jgi:hypothetical protein